MEQTTLVVVAQRTPDHAGICTGVHCVRCGHHVTVKEISPDVLGTHPGAATALPVCEECMNEIRDECPGRVRSVGVG